MLTSRHHHPPIPSPPHDPPQLHHPPPRPHHLPRDLELLARLDRIQVHDIHLPAHARDLPIPGLQVGDEPDSERGHDVEDGGSGAAVEVTVGVAEVLCDGPMGGEDGGGEEGRGVEMEVGADEGGVVAFVRAEVDPVVVGEEVVDFD